MTSILDKIANDKRMEIERLKQELPLAEIRGTNIDRESHRFRDALKSSTDVNIIAELKKASPSRGVLIDDFRPSELAARYAEGGASALSVLTESKYFQGDYAYMAEAGEASELPILCKDFVVDPYQIYHARYNGADAILLIVAILEPVQVRQYLEIAKDLGMDCLIEVHEREELSIAVDCGAAIIGVNNRDLNSFEVDLATSESLADGMPAGVIRVAESGIFTRQDIDRLNTYGYNSFLIGEALVKSANPVALIQELRGQ